MQSATDNIERHCLNNIAELEKCIDDFINWLTKHGVSPHTLYLARFIIEEMGTNIIKYGYDASFSKHISILLFIRIQFCGITFGNKYINVMKM